MDGRSFVNDENIRGLYDACIVIEKACGCDKCPLRDCCLDVSSYLAVCDQVSAGMIDEFLDFADDIENPITEEDIIASYADMERKAERDEYYD